MKTHDLCGMRSLVFGPDGATPINANQWSDSAINHLRQGGLARRTKNRPNRQIALKNVHSECDAQWPFKGTYVRQDILHKTNRMEEQNPQSVCALCSTTAPT
jgi:hypothetical protein